MKKQVMAMAQMLMARNKKVSNKEVKDALHMLFAGDPTFSLKQSEVSEIMAELYVENDWLRELDKTSHPGFTFYKYFEKDAPASGYPLDGQHTATATAPVVSAGNVQTTQSSTPTKTGKTLDENDGNVFYVSGKPHLYVQHKGPISTGRSKCLKAFDDQVPGLTGNNINTCSVKFYNKFK